MDRRLLLVCARARARGLPRFTAAHSCGGARGQVSFAPVRSCLLRYGAGGAAVGQGSARDSGIRECKEDGSAGGQRRERDPRGGGARSQDPGVLPVQNDWGKSGHVREGRDQQHAAGGGATKRTLLLRTISSSTPSLLSPQPTLPSSPNSVAPARRLGPDATSSVPLSPLHPHPLLASIPVRQQHVRSLWSLKPPAPVSQPGLPLPHPLAPVRV